MFGAQVNCMHFNDLQTNFRSNQKIWKLTDLPIPGRNEETGGTQEIRGISKTRGNETQTDRLGDSSKGNLSISFIVH